MTTAKTTDDCPSAQQLAALIDGTISSAERDEFERHLGACPCCPDRLEQIATAGTNLSEVVQKIDADEAPATSAYWPALQSLEAGAAAAAPTGLIRLAGGATPRPVGDATPGGAAGPLARSRNRNAALDFLEPAADGAYLGRLAHFDVMRIIGRGGMGLVLEAFDSRLQRHVALKVLDPDLYDDETARARFCREARAAASITHENVVAVHQVEKAADGRPPYMVMQLVAGESLEQRLERYQGSSSERLPLREIVRIGMQAAQGLAAAHAQGLIHRDIKPGNILLEQPADRVKLTDFGLAKVEDDVKLTRTGFVSGTPLYMAPEQAIGQESDQRSDLFSLGAVLYEMSTGSPPFSGNTPLVIMRNITDSPQRPVRLLNPQIPEWLASTIDRLLAKKPADRIQTAGELVELLEFQWALLKTSSEDLPTVCEVEHRRQTIRNRWIAAAIGAAFLAVGLLAGRYFFPGGPAAVSSIKPEAVLAANSGAVWGVDLDRSDRTAVMGIDDGSLRLWDVPTAAVKGRVIAHDGTVWVARFTPDRSRIITSGDDGRVKLWNPETLSLEKTFEHASAVRSVAISPDGKTLITGDRMGVLRVWPLADPTPGAAAAGAAPAAGGTGTAATVSDNKPADAKAAAIKPLVEVKQPGTVFALALSPDGETLATAGSDKIVRLWNAKTLAAKLPLEGHTAPIYGLSFHPDGRRLASVGWDHTVRIWNTAAGTPVKSWEAHPGDVWSVAYSPDGSRLATGGTDGTVKVWNAESGELLETFAGHTSAVHVVAYVGDGRHIASGSRDGSMRIWKAD